MVFKRSLYIIIMLGICLGCLAGPIDAEKAVGKAVAFMQARGIHPTMSTVKAITPSDSSTPPYFIVNTDKGFVIVSGEEGTDEILGYTDHGNYDPKAVPPGMQSLFDSYAHQIGDMRTNKVKAHRRHLVQRQAISPIIISQWDQGVPTTIGDAYNMLCPIIDGKRSLGGCVAVAMAQVMRHNRWPEKACKGISGYNAGDAVGMLDSLPPYKFDWDNMAVSYTGEETEEEETAVAMLIRYCGQASLTQYSLTSSDAFGKDALKALKSDFEYASTARYVKRNDYNSEKWDDLLYDELTAGRPVIYFGTNAEHGHCFICDGSDGKEFYHINWGWGGRYDGYFKLSALQPENAESGYTLNQFAIIGIMPPHQAPQAISFTDTNVKRICVENWDTNLDGELSYVEASKVTSLNSIFKGNKNIEDFNELQYFVGLQSIEEEAFAGCTSLKTLELPENITTIGEHAFWNCSKLNDITIPDNVSSIGNGAFAACNNMSKLRVSSNNTTYDSRGRCNAIIKTASNTLVAGCGKTIIPSTVIGIEDEAFKQCLSLKTITLPANISTIGAYAFAGCTNLADIYTLCTTPPVAQKYAFDECHPIVYVPQDTKKYYEEAEEWMNLTIVDINENTISCPPISFLREKGGTLTIDLNNSESIIGLQFKLTLPDGVTIKADENQNWLIEKSDRASDLMLHCTQQSDGSYIVMLMSMSLNTIYGNDGSVLTIPIEADDNIEAGTHEVLLDEITITMIGNNNMITGIYPPEFSSFITIKDFETGDVNHDHFINITDVMMTVNHILGNTLGRFHVEDSDLDFNERIDVTDVMLIVKTILDQDIESPNNTSHSSGALFVTKKTHSCMLALEDPSDYNAMQMTVTMPEDGNLPDITLCGANASTHTVSYTLSNDGKLTVVVFSLEGKPFDGNSQDILNICASNSLTDISISDVTLTTIAYKSVKKEPSVANAIEEVVTTQSDPDSPAYNLAGQRVSHSYKGIVIKNGQKYLKR